MKSRKPTGHIVIFLETDLSKFKGFDESKLSELLDFANAGAAIITTRKGALKVMPDKMEIARILDKK